MVTKIDLELKRGDTRRKTFRLKVNGAAVDLTGWSGFVMTIDSDKAPVDTSTQIASINGQIEDAANGVISFTQPGTIAPGKYFYDIQALDSNSEKITLVEGRYIVTQDITKS